MVTLHSAACKVSGAEAIASLKRSADCWYASITSPWSQKWAGQAHPRGVDGAHKDTQVGVGNVLIGAPERNVLIHAPERWSAWRAGAPSSSEGIRGYMGIVFHSAQRALQVCMGSNLLTI